MSFHIEFIAKDKASAKRIISEQQNVPTCVIEFLNQGLEGVTELDTDKYFQIISVKATGHLYNKDYQISNATIEVKNINVLK